MRGSSLIPLFLALALLGGDLLVREHAGECKHHSPDCVLCLAGTGRAADLSAPVTLADPLPVSEPDAPLALPVPLAAAPAPYDSRGPPSEDLPQP